jgi:hypothetical protein
MLPSRVVHIHHFYLHFTPQQELVSQMGPYREQSSEEMGPRTGKSLGAKGRAAAWGVAPTGRSGRALAPWRIMVFGSGVQQERQSPHTPLSLSFIFS